MIRLLAQYHGYTTDNSNQYPLSMPPKARSVLSTLKDTASVAGVYNDGCACARHLPNPDAGISSKSLWRLVYSMVVMQTHGQSLFRPISRPLHARQMNKILHDSFCGLLHLLKLCSNLMHESSRKVRNIFRRIVVPRADDKFVDHCD
jgi:hypothetical protein